jgi:hypothetical protein
MTPVEELWIDPSEQALTEFPNQLWNKGKKKAEGLVPAEIISASLFGQPLLTEQSLWILSGRHPRTP